MHSSELQPAPIGELELKDATFVVNFAKQIHEMRSMLGLNHDVVADTHEPEP